MATTTPRIREAASVEVAAVAERYPGYHTDLVEALVEIARHQDSMTSERARQDLAVKTIEKIGTQAIALGVGESE